VALDAELLLEAFVDYAQEKEWKLTTHEAVRTVIPTFDKASEAGAGSKEVVEYAARKMAFSPLCQEFTYYYYVGNHEIWHKHRNYLGYVTESMVNLSPNLVSHMLRRDKVDTACFVILNADANLAFISAKDLIGQIGPGILVRLKNGVGTPIKSLNVSLKAFSVQDPYPDHRAEYVRQMG
jgi:hypothetical protein